MSAAAKPSDGPWTAKPDRTVHDAEGTPLLRFYAGRNEVANALLVAASLEMLAALREAEDFLSANYENLSNGWIEPEAVESLVNVRAAIAKATGASS